MRAWPTCLRQPAALVVRLAVFISAELVYRQRAKGVAEGREDVEHIAEPTQP